MAPPVKKPGRPGLVDLDMRVLVAEDRPVRRAQRREREAIGGGAGGHPECADLRLEQLGERRRRAAGSTRRRHRPCRAGWRR